MSAKCFSRRIWCGLHLTLMLCLCVAGESNEKTRDHVLFSGWSYQAPRNQYPVPHTENYYQHMQPDAVVEILMDPADESASFEDKIMEHSSITTSIQSLAEYKASCVKEPGCRWECEPRQDGLPPDCDCVCFYTDAKWDDMP